MTLRKITIDNSVRYVKKSEQTRESKPNKIKKQSEQIQSISGSGKTKKIISNSRKQNKYISQNNKKFIKNIAASGFSKLTK